MLRRSAASAAVGFAGVFGSTAGCSGLYASASRIHWGKPITAASSCWGCMSLDSGGVAGDHVFIAIPRLETGRREAYEASGSRVSLLTIDG